AAFVARWMSRTVSGRIRTRPGCAQSPFDPALGGSRSAGISTACVRALPARSSSAVRKPMAAPLRGRLDVLDADPQRLERDLLHHEVGLRQVVGPLVDR